MTPSMYNKKILQIQGLIDDYKARITSIQSKQRANDWSIVPDTEINILEGVVEDLENLIK